ncbi:MAG: 4-(cytidine 5'-diphospho)-2-C-methyl-D-erythritol kinase [Arhodomonas sp.]|nr:4-(cytidine 5'-diphospho)-2-C-methyl-D-erythritol kinase [Arhodomonas sp.]
MRDARALAVFLLAALVTGCGVAPPEPAGEHSILGVDDWEAPDVPTAWSLSGRAALRAGDEAATVSVSWRSDGERYRLTLNGPVGSGSVRLQGWDGRVILRTGDGRRSEADSARALLWRETGYDLPVAYLRWWVRALPAPGLGGEVALDAGDRPVRLHQAEWTITYDDYRRLEGHFPAGAAVRGGGGGRTASCRAAVAARRGVSMPVATIRSAAWPAPAKINRFLHLVGRRADGYHELETLFQFLDRCDLLDFEVDRSGEVRRTGGLPGLAAGDDLAVRAACALQRATGSLAGCTVHVAKRLPAGGGLGAGSSDAATTLVALNHLWGTGLGAEALADIGLALGADVPVFVHGHAAWATGVGERLTPVAPDEPWVVVIDPGVNVSTAAVFGAEKLTRNTPRIRIPRLDTGSLGNDCEPVVRERYPRWHGLWTGSGALPGRG